MAKYNLTEKKQKTPLYRSLLKMETVDDIYQQIMAKFIVEKKYRDSSYSAKKMAEELNTNVRYISAIVNLRYQDNYSQENIWRSGGLYGQQIDRIIAALKDAIPYAENPKQKAVIEKLIEFYQTGNLPPRKKKRSNVKAK